MKRLLLFLLCFCLTGCTYLGATEDILIGSPDDIVISSFDPDDYAPANTTVTNSTVSTDDSESTTTATAPESTMPEVTHLILNISSKKIHYFDNCSYANRMDEKNRKVMPLSAEKSLLAEDYTICSWCANKRG